MCPDRGTRIGARIGKYDRGGALGPPSHSENDDRVNLLVHFCQSAFLRSVLGTHQNLDGPASRNANRGNLRESIRRKTTTFITCERFARIASNPRFAVFSPPRGVIRKKGVQFGKPPDLLFLAVLDFLVFFFSRKSLLFLSIFCFFFQGF